MFNWLVVALIICVAFFGVALLCTANDDRWPVFVAAFFIVIVILLIAYGVIQGDPGLITVNGFVKGLLVLLELFGVAGLVGIVCAERKFREPCSGCFLMVTIGFMVLYAIIQGCRGELCSHVIWRVPGASGDLTNHTSAAVQCISRDDCPNYGICDNMSFEFGLFMDNVGNPPHFKVSGSGFCKECRAFDISKCNPPCRADGGECVVDLLTTDLNLDQKLPYFMNVISAITKPAISLLVFTPTTMPDPDDNFKKWFVANLARLVFIVLSVNTFGVDLWHLRTVFTDSHLCWWSMLWAALTTLASSSNLTAVAAVASMWPSDLIRVDPLDLQALAKKYGVLFAVYWAFLGMCYMPVILVLMVVTVPGLLAYFWVTIMYVIVFAVVGKFISSRASVYLAKKVAGEEAVNSQAGGDEMLRYLKQNVEQEMKKNCWDRWFNEMFGTDVYFFVPLALPLISFITCASARLLTGYGYWNALMVTISERHTTTFLNQVRKRSSTVLDFIWNMI